MTESDLALAAVAVRFALSRPGQIPPGTAEEFVAYVQKENPTLEMTPIQREKIAAWYNALE